MINGWTGGQYSILRVILGVYLCVWGLPIIVARHSAAMLGSLPWFAYGALLLALPVLCVMLAIGWHDWVAAFLIGILSFLFLREFPVPSNASWIILLGLLIVHISVPPAPYGSLAARGRTDPGASWEMPRATYAFAWFTLAAIHIFVLPIDLDWLSAASVGLLLLAVHLRSRPWCWGGLSTVLLYRILLGQREEEAVSMVLVQLFTFDPGWIRPLVPKSSPQPGTLPEIPALMEGGEATPLAESDAPVSSHPSSPTRERKVAEYIFYDGHCGLCHRAVRFVLAEDPDGDSFRFAPLDSVAFRTSIPEAERKTLPDSIVVRTAGGKTLAQGRAILYIMRRLGGLWRLIATVARIIPPPLLDAAYAGVARIRHHLFAKPADVCPILPPRLRGRFDF